MTINMRTRLLSLVLCMALLAAAALSLTGCQAAVPVPPAHPAEGSAAADGASVGEGNTQFSLIVSDLSGAQTHITVHTDEKTVGAALLALGLIAGDEGPYGLYIKTVNGVTADYDRDGVYWAFYVGDEYATSGVEQTQIVPGECYALRVSR